MSFRFKRYSTLVIVLLCAVVPAYSLLVNDLNSNQLKIITTDNSHIFSIEIANTDESRKTGLMFREELPHDSGMLFDFDEERIITMWMKNTPLSLDMIFINSSGEILQIEKNTTPYSQKYIYSKAPIRYVLEINAGISDKLGIKEGNKIEHEILK